MKNKDYIYKKKLITVGRYIILEKKNIIKTVCIAAAVIAASGSLSGCRKGNSDSTQAQFEYVHDNKEDVEKDNKKIIEHDGDIPNFTEEELKNTTNHVDYGNLDDLNRSTGMTAVISKKDLHRKTKRTKKHVESSGYHKVWYNEIPKKNGNLGANLFLHCSLLETRLGGSNNDDRNFFTGTYSMKHNGMNEYEKKVIKFLKTSDNHVLYRVTPIYTDDNLIADGVQMEAMSMEDKGEGLCFNVFIKNEQQGIHINYKTGTSYKEN